jgi:hypothetical protein
MGISQAALFGGLRLHKLWKDSDFDFALKGRGFSRAAIAVKWRER